MYLIVAGLVAEAAASGIAVVSVDALVGKPGLDLGGRAGALRHVERGDGVAFAVDDGEAALQGDFVLMQDAVDGSAEGAARGWCCGAAFRAVVGSGQRRGDGFGLDARVGRGVLGELQRERVGVVAHLVGFCENQRSTARFIRP